jgi:integrase/recombinase XerD
MNIPKYIDLFRKDLLLKAYAKNSIENYVSQVNCFLERFNSEYTEPSKISEASIKRWFLESNSINGRKHKICALKLFYKLTIKQPKKLEYIEYPRSEKKLPIILSQQEIQKMFDVCGNLKHKTILALLYSCGLRVSELINLKWQNIDRQRRVINVVNSKGNKDRQVMLDDDLIDLLIKYFRKYQPKNYVLNGQNCEKYSAESIRNVVKQMAKSAGVNKRVYAHLIRHCCFTHMAENGTDINLIQRIAGHGDVKTTNIYLHLSTNHISKIQSPIKQIKI